MVHATIIIFQLGNHKLPGQSQRVAFDACTIPSRHVFISVPISTWKILSCNLLAPLRYYNHEWLGVHLHLPMDASNALTIITIHWQSSSLILFPKTHQVGQIDSMTNPTTHNSTPKDIIPSWTNSSSTDLLCWTCWSSLRYLIFSTGCCWFTPVHQKSAREEND